MKIIMLIFTTFVLLFGSVLTYADSKEYYSPVYYMVNRDTSEVIASKDENKKIHPASLTKIMTILLAVELLNENQLNETFEIPTDVFTNLRELDASVAGFDPGEKVKVIDILYGIMLPSGADASRAIAFYLKGSEKNFVKAMNEKAKKLGLKNTNFENTSGLDHPSHLSTAADIHIILENALKQPLFKKIFEAYSYTSSPTNLKKSGYIWMNKNLDYALQHENPSPITGAKSGYTKLSGSSLASIGSVEGTNYLLVTSGAPYSPFEFFNVQDAIKFYKSASSQNAPLNSENKKQYGNSENINNISAEKYPIYIKIILFIISLTGLGFFIVFLQDKIYYRKRR
ncbi:MAG: hypothetical protein RR565_08480 [Erysipelothrix sp.]